MMKRTLVAPLLASGLALASGACGSAKINPGPGGGLTGGSSSVASGGTSSSSGGSAAGDDIGSDDIAPDDLNTTGSGGSAAVNLNGGHMPLTAEDVAGLTSAECSQFDAPVEPQAPVIELIVDVSLSMSLDVNGCYPDKAGVGADCPIEGSGLPSRWDQFLPAILAALDGIPDGAAVGMQLFPTTSAIGGGGGTACAAASGRVAIAKMGPVGSTQRAALADKLNTAVLEAGTPTLDGLDAGQKELTAFTGPGKKFLLLITDGEPTQGLGCTPHAAPALGDTRYTAPIISAVEGWATSGIGTFVVGSPGSEVSQAGEDMRPFLSKTAQVGGTGLEGCMLESAPYCHFDTTASPDFAGALTEGLKKITELVNDPCVLQVPPPPSGESLDKSLTNVILTSPVTGSSLILRDDTPADCTQGWTWSGDTTIQLCPASCEQVKADVGANVNASFGCETMFD